MITAHAVPASARPSDSYGRPGPVSWPVRQLTARNMPFPHIIAILAAAGVLQDHQPAAVDVEPPHEPRALHRPLPDGRVHAWRAACRPSSSRPTRACSEAVPAACPMRRSAESHHGQSWTVRQASRPGLTQVS
jgi:hypothetical protein